MKRFIVTFLLLTCTVAPVLARDWTNLTVGLDIGFFKTKTPSSHGDSKITVLRIDPDHWDLQFLGLDTIEESEPLTAKQWAEKYQSVAVINAGMFADDHRTHLGYVKSGDHVCGRKVSDYQSVAAFNPRPGSEVPRFCLFDLDAPGMSMDQILQDYTSAVQNLRLIKKPGKNRWKKPEQWSEALLAEDVEGRMLFIFCRSPFTMRDLNDELLSMGLGIVAAQHLEGGPEAQLYVKHGEYESEQFGSYETGFIENDFNLVSWPVPNVLAIRGRDADGQ